ncbi:MAG TPA: Trm112 family protein [Longimicrobiaceae bacterium]|nr:Trm112 family protein [Longimicrobiaceae bacterium]
MHIVLTDALACPRCGPEFGLIVLADSLQDRRIVEGSLGCANCREAYPVRGGVPDLRGRGEAAPELPLARGGEPERALRIAALLGVGAAPGLVLLVGAAPELMAEISALLPETRVVGASASPAPEGLSAGLDWLRVGGRLPLRNGALRGIAFPAGLSGWSADEIRRVLARDARVVVEDAGPRAAERLRGAGLDLLLEQDGIAVASNSAPR